MKTIEIFTGNRAEFGLLHSIIDLFSTGYKIKLVISGAHLLENWSSVDEIERAIESFQAPQNINIVKLPIQSHSFPLYINDVNRQYVNYRKNNTTPIEFCLFLGDRIETMAYALSAMYLENILIHLCGGDVSTFSGFDHNVRHAITKISHLHLVYSEHGKKVVEQLGEEDWRICNTGITGLDIINSLSLFSKQELKSQFNLVDDDIILCTYHPVQYISAQENLNLFKMIVKGVKDSGKKVIITYPNNDPGHEKIIREIDTTLRDDKQFIIAQNLGIHMYYSIFKNLNTVLIGNSSSLITESPYFCLPSLLLGKRQQGRYRGKNVTEMLSFTSDDITRFINDTFIQYVFLKKSFKNQQYIYGDGKSAQRALSFVDDIFSHKKRPEILQKSFKIMH